MPVFSLNEEGCNKPDYHLFQNSPVCLCFSETILSKNLEDLKNSGYDVSDFDCRKWISEKEMHLDFKKKLNFPDYYGCNLAALNDCIFDSPISVNAAGKVLIFRNFDGFCRAHSDLAWYVLDLLCKRSRDFLLFGIRFFIVIHTNDPYIRFKPMGAFSPSWNPKEREYKNRAVDPNGPFWTVEASD